MPKPKLKGTVNLLESSSAVPNVNVEGIPGNESSDFLQSKITIQTIKLDNALANKPEKYVLLLKSNGKKHTKSKWSSSHGGWDVNFQLPPKSTMKNLSIEICRRQVMHFNCFQDEPIGIGELNIEELKKAVQGGALEFRKTIKFNHDLLNLELGLMLHLSVDTKTLLPSVKTPDTKAFGVVQDPTPLTNANTVASDVTTPPAPAPQNIPPLNVPEISITPSPAGHRIPSQLEIQNTPAARGISPDLSLYSARPPAPNELLGKALPFIAVAGLSDFPTNSIKKALELLDRVSKVHPISEVAWFVISSAFRVVIAQHERDQEIVELFEEMSRVYETATSEDTLNRIEEFSTLFDAMVTQTTDCCMFISNYSSGGYFRRMLGNISASQKIQSFKSAFQALWKRFNDAQLRVNTAMTFEVHELIVALRPQMEDLAYDAKIQKLETEQLPPREPCLAGTRQETLFRITDWIVRGEQSILWLSGVAGCGKSSVMATLNDQLINMGCSSRLATFIRFDRFEFSDPSLFIKALAYQLASFDSRLAKVIADTIESRPQVLNHSRLWEQFQALILHPLQKCTTMRDEGPIVVLIDGLDECMQEPGGSNGFRQLLALFSDPGTFETIPFVRFIIASRPEQRIRQEFGHQKHILHFPLDITSDETKADISHFLIVKFGEIYVRNPDFETLCAELNAVECLSERASGLFIWAATIFRFVEGFPSEKRLRAALDLTPPPNALTALTDLYRTILDVVVDEADEDIKQLIRAVFGLLIASGKAYELSPLPNAPKLTPTILRDFLEKSGHDVGSDILPLLSKLGSVLPGELDLHSDVFLLHKSLDDFLVDEERSGDWHVDVTNYWSPQLAYACVVAVRSMVLERRPEYTAVFRYSSHFWVTSCVVAGWGGGVGGNDVGSVPRFEGVLVEMVRRYFLRWIYVVHSVEIPQVSDRAWIHSISGNLQESSKKLSVESDREGVVELLDQITSFQYQLTRLGAHQLTLSRTLKVFFLFLLCEAGSSSLLYKLYMPQFIEIANGSTEFMEILVAIEEENTLRSFSTEEKDGSVGEAVKDTGQLEITGVPEKDDVKEMLEAACDRDLYQGGSDDEWGSRSFNDSASTFASV